MFRKILKPDAQKFFSTLNFFAQIAAQSVIETQLIHPSPAVSSKHKNKKAFSQNEGQDKGICQQQSVPCPR